MTTPSPRIRAAVATPDQPAGRCRGTRRRRNRRAWARSCGRPDRSSAAAGRQRTADHGHDSGADGQRVAPRTRQCDGQAANARRLPGRLERRQPEAGTRSTARLVAGSQPASSASTAGRPAGERAVRRHVRARAWWSAPRCQRRRCLCRADAVRGPARPTVRPPLRDPRIPSTVVGGEKRGHAAIVARIAARHITRTGSAGDLTDDR